MRLHRLVTQVLHVLQRLGHEQGGASSPSEPATASHNSDTVASPAITPLHMRSQTAAADAMPSGLQAMTCLPRAQTPSSSGAGQPNAVKAARH